MGQTPWFAQVPLDPLFRSQSQAQPPTGSRARGPAADEGVRPTLPEESSFCMTHYTSVQTRMWLAPGQSAAVHTGPIAGFTFGMGFAGGTQKGAASSS
jgi:hypothetical protein